MRLVDGLVIGILGASVMPRNLWRSAIHVKRPAFSAVRGGSGIGSGLSSDQRRPGSDASSAELAPDPPFFAPMLEIRPPGRTIASEPVIGDR
jgi:hypothetical protein